jgi:hypothetical protein
MYREVIIKQQTSYLQKDIQVKRVDFNLKRVISSVFI